MARVRWKSMLSESLVQLAVVLSLLRTDIRIYLRQYSQYPEIQQALLGQSVGLQVTDSYRNNDIYPLLSSKHIDDTDTILNEINRLIRSPPQYATATQNPIISAAWLVADESAHASTSVDRRSANSVPSQSELSRQDVELIESLWKEDFNLGFGRQGAFNIQPKDQAYEDDLDEYLVDEDTGDRIPVPESFPTDLAALDDNFVPVDHSPVFTTQTSLERALDELSYDDNNNPDTATIYVCGHNGITNSSMIDPPGFSTTEDDDLIDNIQATNSSGVLWGGYQSQLPTTLPRQDSLMNISSTLPDIDPTLFPDLDMNSVDDLDLDLDSEHVGLLGYLPTPNPSRYTGSEIRDSISDDSAVGSSPAHSWSDGASTSGSSERHSISSDAYLDLDEGAVGGYTECKTEPYDVGFFDYTYNQPSHLDEYEEDYEPDVKYGAKNVVTHDHTYGAPYGGTPHVRKMDIKKPKIPSRGLAHDVQMCKKFKIPFSVETIINSPVDEFNKLMEKHRLSSKQANLVRDIRRRGKNKVAAQNCRQKKIGEYTDLEGEVDELKEKRDALSLMTTTLTKKSNDVRKHIDLMSTELFQTLRDENGMPYNTSQFSLEVGRDGEIHVTPTEQASSRSRNSRHGGKKLDKKRRKR